MVRLPHKKIKVDKISGVLLLINHVQNGYMDLDNPDEVELYQKILDFVEEARPHVDNVAWSYAMNKSSLNGLPFNLATERPSTFQPNDLTLTNNDGQGLDSGFLQHIFDIKPDHVILVGVFFEACSAATAATIKQNINTRVSVPMDMTNPAIAPFEEHYRLQRQELSDKNIDVTSSSQTLLDRLTGKHSGLDMQKENGTGEDVSPQEP